MTPSEHAAKAEQAAWAARVVFVFIRLLGWVVMNG
jgi:hypothetical protein